MANNELVDTCVKAMAAHSTWKVKFKQLLSNEVKIDAVTARRHDACDFGKWLTGSGRSQLGASFAAIDAAHKHFHSVVGDIVDSHNAGQGQKVTTLLGPSGPFAHASATLTNLIVAVRNKAA